MHRLSEDELLAALRERLAPDARLPLDEAAPKTQLTPYRPPAKPPLPGTDNDA